MVCPPKKRRTLFFFQGSRDLQESGSQGRALQGHFSHRHRLGSSGAGPSPHGGVHGGVLPRGARARQWGSFEGIHSWTPRVSPSRNCSGCFNSPNHVLLLRKASQASRHTFGTTISFWLMRLKGKLVQNSCLMYIDPFSLYTDVYRMLGACYSLAVNKIKMQQIT